MKRYVLGLKILLILLLLAGFASAEVVSEFHLKDGSVLRGVIIAHSGRVYSIRTQSLGVIRIHESKISAIGSQGVSNSQDAGKSSSKSSSASSSSGMSNKEITRQSQALEKKMMQDQDIMNIISTLSNDPEFMEALSDPEIMAAVSAGDVNTLMANPKFMKLMNNPKVQQITKKVSE